MNTALCGHPVGLRNFTIATGLSAVTRDRLRPAWPLPLTEELKCRPLVGAASAFVMERLAFGFLWFFAFSIPWENTVLIPGIGTVARLIGVLSLALGALAIAERQRIRLPSLGLVIMMLSVLWSATSYLWSVSPERTLVVVYSYFQLLVMAWLIWELAPHERQQVCLIQAYVLGTYVSGIDTVYRYLSQQETHYLRYAGSGFNPNELGLLMALSIPLSYYLLIRSKGWMLWVYKLQLGLAGLTILLTASRGALLAGLMALSIVPLTRAGLTRSQRIATVVAAVGLVYIGLFFVPETSWERLSTIPTELKQGTLSQRTIIWTAGLEVFRDYPVLGVGSGAFGESVMPALSEPQSAHNTFLSILVEQGLVGFGFFCGLMGVLLISAKQMPPLPQKVWLIAMCVWTIAAWSGSWELGKPTWFLFSLLIGQRATVLDERRL